MSHNNKRWNTQTYNTSKLLLLKAIDTNIRTIILFGSGGNGKTHLICEMRDLLIKNTYSIVHPDETYFNQKKKFLEYIKNNDGKKILECLFDPYLKWNASKDDVVVIDMNTQ